MSSKELVAQYPGYAKARWMNPPEGVAPVGRHSPMWLLDMMSSRSWRLRGGLKKKKQLCGWVNQEFNRVIKDLIICIGKDIPFKTPTMEYIPDTPFGSLPEVIGIPWPTESTGRVLVKGVHIADTVSTYLRQEGGYRTARSAKVSTIHFNGSYDKLYPLVLRWLGVNAHKRGRKVMVRIDEVEEVLRLTDILPLQSLDMLGNIHRDAPDFTPPRRNHITNTDFHMSQVESMTQTPIDLGQALLRTMHRDGPMRRMVTGTSQPTVTVGNPIIASPFDWGIFHTTAQL